MSSESQPKKKMITLKSSDGEKFVVEEAAALQSETVKHMIELGCAGTIPLLEVTSVVLSKVIEYCKKHVEPGHNVKDIQDWDKKFMEVDINMLYDLIMAIDLIYNKENFHLKRQLSCYVQAANYLNIESLLELTCQAVIDMTADKTQEEILGMFNMENYFIPDEEERIPTTKKRKFI